MPPKKDTMPGDMREITQRLDRLQSEFYENLSKFKEEFQLSKETNDNNSEQSENLVVKFQEFESKIMSDMENIKCAVKIKIEDLENKIDKTMQTFNNNSLLIHGIPEMDERGEENNMYNILIKLFKEKINVDVEKSQIADCYRLGAKRSMHGKTARPVIVRFIHKTKRDEIFYKKSALKGKQLIVTELLTKTRLEIFKKCNTIYKNQCWTVNGNIVVIKNNTKIFITNKNDLKKHLGLD